jgi:outer membrane murein-binding lipoprotein Lpp
MERVTLLSQRLDILLSYSTNQEIPANVRSALQRAAELRRTVDTADTAIRNIEAQRERLTADQDRTRRNLEAAGNQTPQGQDFLRRLVSLDSEIDALSVSLERANAEARAARTSFENYLNNLNL